MNKRWENNLEMKGDNRRYLLELFELKKKTFSTLKKSVSEQYKKFFKGWSKSEH